MKSLPSHIRRSIGEYEQIRYFCRRSSYEVVPEFALGVGSAIAIFCFVWDLVRWTENQNLWWLLIFCGPALWIFIHELLEWSAEVHVVTDYLAEHGGVYYRFSGFFNYRTKRIPVHSKDPIISTDISLGARLWSFATGIRLKQVHLATTQEVFVKNKLMPEKFEKALKDVQGSPAVSSWDDDPNLVKMSRELRAIKNEEAIPAYKAERMLETLWYRELAEDY